MQRHPRPLAPALGLVATVALLVTTSTTSATIGRAQTQTGSSEIVIGMSAALSGPSAALGRGMRVGVEAYLKRVNDNGGLQGRRVRLVALDDSYQADPVEENMRRLIDQEQALAVLGSVGTAGAQVAVPMANASKVLLFGAFSGASVLRRQPPDRYVINFRASYAEETGVMVRGLLKRGIRPEEIAFFTQNDAYGDSGYEGAAEAIRALGYPPFAHTHGRYERGTLDVEDAILELVQAKVQPRAIIMVGAYAATAKFIRLARQLVPKAILLSVSFVGASALTEALGADGEGVIITQVVPHWNSDLPGIAEYRQALRRFTPDAPYDFISLEGYLVAKTFMEGARRVRGRLTRESIIDAIEGLGTLDIGIGRRLTLSPTRHQASQDVWLTMIQNGALVSFEW